MSAIVTKDLARVVAIRAGSMGRALTDAVNRASTDVMPTRSSWRRNRLRYTTRYDERTRAVAVVHEQTFSAAAGERGGFHRAEMTSNEGRTPRREDRLAGC
jgi:hypothetical protein